MAGVAVGLDMGSVMMVGAARGADLQMLAEVLPQVEAAILVGESEEASPSGE